MVEMGPINLITVDPEQLHPEAAAAVPDGDPEYQMAPAEAVLRTIEPQLPLCLARDARQVLAAGDRDARRRGYQVGGAHQQRQPARLAQARLQQRQK